MATSNIAIKTLRKEKANESAKAGVDSISKGSILIMGGISAAIGAWAIACFIGAAMGGGLVSLIGGWLGSIIGM